MMPAQSQSILVGKICLTSSHIIALSSTIFRLYRRMYTHRWWWDDTTACLALISDCAYLASLWSPTS
ncbi:hypothetical protein BD779DRAFT_96120 [Infundibulicybe gibba]|nr:hypothetical protein BD779DRAFT_96120 [Infundibulicybe gibba]